MSHESPLRIAMIGPFGMTPKGTMRVRALPLARELVAQGQEVSILMPPWHTPEAGGRSWQEDGVSLRYVELGPRLPLLTYAAITGRLVRQALALQPDIVHCFKPKAYSGLAAWWLWQRRRWGQRSPRLVVDEDDWEGSGGWNDLEPYRRALQRFFAWQERWGLTHCDAVTVASRALQSLVWSLGVPPKRVHYLPNGVIPGAEGDGQRIRAEQGLGDAPVVLLYTRFFEFDVARAVQVFRRVLEEIPAARLLVVGQGLFEADDRRFDALVAREKLDSCVVRAGWVPMPELPDYFAAADVAIYPSDDTLVNRSKCPVKLADLVGAGVPVVGAAVGQIRETIQHNETGLLVRSGDVEAMAASVVRLLQEPGERRRLGAGATRYARQELHWRVLAERLQAIYWAAAS